LQFFAGILAEIAGARYEYWSSFAPLPVEVVLSAGQRAKDENSSGEDFVQIYLYICFKWSVYSINSACFFWSSK
jgi:hypothetical protein